MSAMHWLVWLRSWGWWLPLACALTGCGQADNTELLKARAAKQDAEWTAQERQERIAALEQQYSELMTEFSDYQTEAAAACKRGAK